MCGCGNCCYFESFFITVYYIPRKPGTRPGDFFLCPKKKKLAPATQSTEHLKFQFSGDRALGANPSPPLERIMIRPIYLDLIPRCLLQTRQGILLKGCIMHDQL